jgi:Fe-S cluster biosynthesis and repair protein YggX
MWEERMKMILNEYRLMPWQKEAQELVKKHMEDFFFGRARRSAGYVPEQTTATARSGAITVDSRISGSI